MNAKSKRNGRYSRSLVLTQEAVDLLEEEMRKRWENSEGRSIDKNGKLRATPKKLSRDDKAEMLGLEKKTVDCILRPLPVSESALRTAFSALNITPPFSIARYCVAYSPPPGNVPYRPTPCIGRETQIREIQELLETNHLVTLTGTGGIGKTRLAIAVAEEMQSCFADGIWFVEMAEVTDPTLVPQTVALTLGVQENKDYPLLQALTDFLHGNQLLILDNCEHLLDACALLVDHLIASSPALRVLATSRERLNLPSERPFRVPSLPAPDPKMMQGKEKSLASLLLDYDSARLFVARASMRRADFHVTEQNAPLLASICHRLDGIPLAIELAAGRLGGMSLDDLERGLNNCFHLLTGGSRAALPRQQTLRAAMDWSYNLLEEPEKTLLCRLSVFRGGWRLEAAAPVCTGDDLECWEVLGLLTSLNDKSLVVFEEREGKARYRLLETVHQYAAERFVERGEEAAVRQRHRDYFLALAEEINRKLGGQDHAHWLDEMEAEYPNLKQAIAFCLEDPEGGEAGLRLGSALQEFLWTRGYFREGRELYTALLAHPQAKQHTEARASALNGSGALARMQGDYVSARSLHEQSLEIYRELGNKAGIAYASGNLGIVMWHLQEAGYALDLIKESLKAHRDLNNDEGIANALGNLGIMSYYQKEYASARLHLNECLEINQKLENQSGIALCLYHLGMVHSHLQEYASARPFLEESLKINQKLGNLSEIILCLEAFAGLACKENRWMRTARLNGASQGLQEKMDSALTRSPHAQEEHDFQLAEARRNLGEEAFSTAWAKGCCMTLEQAVAYALEEPVE